tara:strand:- start:11114 stop:11401 length:288 start_codon:yes stop_codon:yes gene_type:complete
MSESTKVFDLAAAKITGSDEEQAIKNLRRSVRDNQHAWTNSCVNAERALEAAEDRLDNLKCCVTASAEQVLDAHDDLALAVRKVERIMDLTDERF